MKPPSLLCFRLSNPESVTYDSSGNRLKEEIKDPEGTLTKTVSYQYDVLGRLNRINNPDGNYSEYSYDSLGKPTSIRDHNGETTTYVYDSQIRLTTIDQPGNVTTIMAHDDAGHVTSATDDNSVVTQYVYDDRGQLYQATSPDTGVVTYSYDEAGNRRSRTDARGITVAYEYDELNRLIFENFPNDMDITYTYDTCTNGKGRLCQVQDQAGTTTYAYSPKGELVQEDRLFLGVNYVTGYQYDDNGNLDVLTYPSGRSVSYEHDNTDQITDVLTTPPGGAQQTVSSSVSYYPFGGIRSLTYGNGLIRTVGYDLQYRVTGIQSGTIQDLTFVPDPNGNITDIIDNLDLNKNESFYYDALDRLEEATGPWGNLSWTYDGAGNRLSSQDDLGTTTYSYESGTNRLSSLSGAVSLALEYDAAGNVITENTREYLFNEDHRLTQVTDGAIIGEYSYNAYGQRVLKTVDGLTTVYHFGHDGRLLAETSSTGIVTAEYIYLSEQPIVKATETSLLYIHTDHLNTPAIMTDVSAGVVWELSERPFGESADITGGEELHIRFPGQYYDDESGLHYNWYRTYNPSLGRYLSPDPLGLEGAINLYAYADDNPLTKFDFFGLQVPPGPPDAQAYVCCDGKGGYKICWNKKPGEPYQSCIEKHEKDHIDWYKNHPKNKPDHYKGPDPCDFDCGGTPGEHGPNPPKPDGEYRFKGKPSDKEELECRGYKVEIDCLKRQKTRYPKHRGPIDQRIERLKNHAKQKGWQCKW